MMYEVFQQKYARQQYAKQEPQPLDRVAEAPASFNAKCKNVGKRKLRRKMMMRLVIDQFKNKQHIPLTATSTKRIKGLIVKEYMNEYHDLELKEALIKSSNIKLVKSACIFPEDRGNRMMLLLTS